MCHSDSFIHFALEYITLTLLVLTLSPGLSAWRLAPVIWLLWGHGTATTLPLSIKSIKIKVIMSKGTGIGKLMAPHLFMLSKLSELNK